MLRATAEKWPVSEWLEYTASSVSGPSLRPLLLVVTNFAHICGSFGEIADGIQGDVVRN